MPESNYISLQEASKYTPFDSNYLGLLIRNGRLFAVKKGRRWYTTKEAIDDYMQNSAQVKMPPPFSSRAMSLLAQIGIGSLSFTALLAFSAISNAFFLEEDKNDVVQIPTQQTLWAEGKLPAVVSEGEEVSSKIVRR